MAISVPLLIMNASIRFCELMNSVLHSRLSIDALAPPVSESARKQLLAQRLELKILSTINTHIVIIIKVFMEDIIFCTSCESTVAPGIDAPFITSRGISHPSTSRAQRRLTSEFRWDLVHST